MKEKGPERRLDVDACVKLQIPMEFYESLKWGEDYTSSSGKVIPNNQLTTEGHRNRSYAYMTDTIFDPEYIVPIVQGADLLYHEATFLHDRASRAQETHHSTSRQAAEIAKAAQVKQLLIGHFSARYKDAEPLLAEARTIFADTYEAVEGSTFVI